MHWMLKYINFLNLIKLFGDEIAMSITFRYDYL